VDNLTSSSSSTCSGSNSNYPRRPRRRKATQKHLSKNEEDPSILKTPSTRDNISQLEKLIRSHPIWFLPNSSRDEVMNLLDGKECGVRTPFLLGA